MATLTPLPDLRCEADHCEGRAAIRVVYASGVAVGHFCTEHAPLILAEVQADEDERARKSRARDVARRLRGEPFWVSAGRALGGAR